MTKDEELQNTKWWISIKELGITNKELRTIEDAKRW